MPDGLNDLVEHNLISFKSFREPLDDWALKELTGHYVNYRKQTSPKGELLAEDKFHLYAVCARSPRELLKVVHHVELQPGVYECIRGTDRIRIVVAGELSMEEHNAMIHLFSAARERIQYGKEHHRQQSENTSTMVNIILNEQQEELMPYTFEDLQRDYIAQIPVKRRLKGVTLEEILTSLPDEDVKALKKLAISKTTVKRKPKRKKN